MAVKPHKEFPWPGDTGVTVWRYLDFAKYLSMLESNALFFCRLDKLNDPFEGSRPGPSLEARDALMTQVLGSLDISEEKAVERVAAMRESDTRVARAMTKWCAVNCWHLGEYESAAMWDVYMRAGAGVAIRSTFDRLKASLEGSETTVYLGKVTYIDYSKDAISDGNVLTPAMHKRRSFEHESELRALVMEMVPGVDGNALDFEASRWEVGLEVEVDLETLVEAVHISPVAPSWFAGLVTSVTARYGFEWEVTQSVLLEDPLF